MRIGVLTVLFKDLPFEEALDKAVAAGVTAVEIGAGGYPGSEHCPVDDLLTSAAKREDYLAAIPERPERPQQSASSQPEGRGRS